MSAKLSGLVLERFPFSDHTPFVVALVLADAADHDGSNVRLSVGRISVLSRTSERTVQYQLRKFEQIGFIRVARLGGGRNRPTEYRIDTSWLEGQPSVLEKKGAHIAPIAESTQKGCSPSPETTQIRCSNACTQPLPHYPKTTTSPSSATKHQVSKQLHFEPSVLPYQALLQRLLLETPAEAAQAITDEVAGAVEAISRGQRPPIVNMGRWIEKLRDCARAGSFEQTLGLAVKARRINRRSLEQHAAHEDAARKLPSVSREDAFAAIKAIMRTAKTSNSC